MPTPTRRPEQIRRISRISRALAAAAVALLAAAAPAQAQDRATDQPTNQTTDQTTDQTAGQTPASRRGPEPGLESPRETLRTFISAMSITGARADSAIDQALECIDFPPGLVRSTEVQTAVEIYGVINRIERVNYASHPDDNIEDAYVFFPDTRRSVRHLALANKYPGHRITLTEDASGSWRFSRETAETIHALWIQVEGEAQIVKDDAGPRTLMGRVRDTVPSQLKGRLILGLEPWQWIGIVAVAFLGVLLDRGVRVALTIMWRSTATKRGRALERDDLRRAVRPFGMLAAAGLWYTFLEAGFLPPSATRVLLVAVRLFLMVSSVWAAWRVTDLIGARIADRAAQTGTKFDDLLVPLVKKTVKIVITAIGLIYIASALAIEILPLLTGLGIGGLALAFAAKDTIENIFGSLSVILDRPFEIGDWVTIGDTTGTVEDLSFRSTRVRTFYNSLVTIPNATLVRATVDNYGRRKYRRYKTVINVTYATTPDQLEAFCAGIRQIVQLHPYTRKDMYHVWLNEFGAHSLDILVYIFFECPDWAVELRERHRFMLDIIRLADKLGVEFAFPTQTLHLYKEDHGLEHTPADAPDQQAERRATLIGARAARELSADQPWRTEIPGPVEFKEEPDEDHEIRGSAE